MIAVRLYGHGPFVEPDPSRRRVHDVRLADRKSPYVPCLVYLHDQRVAGCPGAACAAKVVGVGERFHQPSVVIAVGSELRLLEQNHLVDVAKPVTKAVTLFRDGRNFP